MVDNGRSFLGQVRQHLVKTPGGLGTSQFTVHSPCPRVGVGSGILWASEEGISTIQFILVAKFGDSGSQIFSFTAPSSIYLP